jgi:hypothetical protein
MLRAFVVRGSRDTPRLLLPRLLVALLATLSALLLLLTGLLFLATLLAALVWIAHLYLD